jgi:hypothetical protein
VKKNSVICWNFIIISDTLGFGFFLFYLEVLPTVSGLNIFAASYWLDILKELSYLKISLFLFGFLFIHFYGIYRLVINFYKPFLCAFKKENIFLYALGGVTKIPWEKMKLVDIKEIENLQGRKSKYYKFFEVTLQLAEEKIQFQFETFSDTKVAEILDMWRVFKDSYRFENEG